VSTLIAYYIGRYFSLCLTTENEKSFDSSSRSELLIAHAKYADTRFIGHKYFSVEKSRDPDSRRRAPSFDSRHPHIEPTKINTRSECLFLFMWRWRESNPRAERDLIEVYMFSVSISFRQLS